MHGTVIESLKKPITDYPISGRIGYVTSSVESKFSNLNVDLIDGGCEYRVDSAEPVDDGIHRMRSCHLECTTHECLLPLRRGEWTNCDDVFPLIYRLINSDIDCRRCRYLSLSLDRIFILCDIDLYCAMANGNFAFVSMDF